LSLELAQAKPLEPGQFDLAPCILRMELKALA